MNIKPMSEPTFKQFCHRVIDSASTSHYFDFASIENHHIISNRATLSGYWPFVGYTETATAPAVTDTTLKAGLAKGQQITVSTRELLNFLQLVSGVTVDDFHVTNVHKSGFCVVTANKALKIAPPKPATKPLKLTTDLKATAKAGDKLSVAWSDGVAPYSVKVTDDSGSIIVDYVDLKSATKYEYDTTTKGAGKYQIYVKDSKGDEVSSVVCTVS